MRRRGLARDGAILAIAAPAMAANLATALFGAADTLVIGRLGDPAAQGGVEVGAKLMMGLLVVFNFLRSSSVAETARAAGRGDAAAQTDVLARALLIALALALLLLLLYPLLVPLGLRLLAPPGRVAALARAYVAIRYPGVALWLLNAAAAGALIGRRRVRAVLACEAGANLVHIGLDVLAVLGLGWGVAGVAAATLASEGVKSALLALAVLRSTPARRLLERLAAPEVRRPQALAATLRLNRDLFLRTVLLTGAILLLTASGARLGPATLAANAVVYQLFTLSALLLDGFESAAQVLCGEALGARRRSRFTRSVGRILLQALGAAVLIALAFLAAAPAVGPAFSTAPAVAAEVGRLAPVIVLLPLAGVASYVFDGVFIGSGWTRAMLATMGLALAGFWAALRFLEPRFGDAGLWTAFLLFLALRGAGQAAALPGLLARSLPRRAGGPQTAGERRRR